MPAKALKHRDFMETVPLWQRTSRGHRLSSLQTCPAPGSQLLSPCSLLACSVAVPWPPWGPRVQHNHSASSAGTGLHPCMQWSSNVLESFQKGSKTWIQRGWNCLLNMLTSFLPTSLLDPKLEERASRLWMNVLLVASLEIAWKWLGESNT